jgi:4-amino-4-deoxy-L-arabinose transferase-like glycosyltransferase
VAGVTRKDSLAPRRRVMWYVFATALAVFTYFYGLDSQHIPKNGDEYPYEHITRMTAASGRWLPLQSELKEMRNTKPPLLFWQGGASTNAGQDWTLWHLRWPSVIYTLLTAGMALLLGWKLTGSAETGLVASLTFLAFFSTYRYGRPFLTDAPSVFWLFVPWFALLYWRTAIAQSRVGVPILLGLTTGIGLLYKSFALLLPVGLCLAWWYLHQRRYHLREFLSRDAGRLAIVSIVALATFSLWFVLDPDPRAVLNEFVLEENAGKFDASPRGYLRNFFWGSSSVWRLLVSYPLNAGVLMFPVIALGVISFKRRVELSDGERLLWMWVITLLVVFSLPNQRDERYLLPAMPALAVLGALNWERIHRHAFTASLITTGVLVLLLAYLSLQLDRGVPGDPLYSAGYWALVLGTVSVVAFSLMPTLTRTGVTAAILLAMVCFAAFLRPFDGPRGAYSADVQDQMKGRTVWVPINFIAREEGHRFLLPGADVRGYPLEPALTANELAKHYPLFAVRLPIDAPPVTTGRVLGQRLDIATRHTPDQIMEMVHGRVFEHLFVKELLVEAAGPDRQDAH